jgi:hypothetical protein
MYTITFFLLTKKKAMFIAFLKVDEYNKKTKVINNSTTQGLLCAHSSELVLQMSCKFSPNYMSNHIIN